MSTYTTRLAFNYSKHNDYILPALTFKNSSGFYPQGVFLCFLLLPQKTRNHCSKPRPSICICDGHVAHVLWSRDWIFKCYLREFKPTSQIYLT